MYKILSKFRIGDRYVISVEGDRHFLKIGLELIDENENVYIVESIGMVHYQNNEDIKKNLTHAELVLAGDINKLGESLSILG